MIYILKHKDKVTYFNFLQVAMKYTVTEIVKCTLDIYKQKDEKRFYLCDRVLKLVASMQYERAIEEFNNYLSNGDSFSITEEPVVTTCNNPVIVEELRTGQVYFWDSDIQEWTLSNVSFDTFNKMPLLNIKKYKNNSIDIRASYKTYYAAII